VVFLYYTRSAKVGTSNINSNISFQVLEFFNQLNVSVCSRASLYNMQSVYVNPIICRFWTRMQTAMFERFRGQPLSVTGDGQFDSPGFSARFCFYSIIEATSKLVLDFYIAEKTQVEYSAKMEPFATKILLKRLHKKRISLRVCTTDRSSQLKTLMKDINEIRRERGMEPIKHSFDVWHMVKSVTKDLFAASKLKKCQTLGVWIRSVRNMMWHAFSTCRGDALLLREMILSIPQHVSGVHTFPENQLFRRCLHEELTGERNKPWLKEGSLSMKKLIMAIRGHKDSRLRDLEMMTEFQHTGVNESLNALHNVYFTKSTSFGHPQAYVRGCLTAIDHNVNVNRKTALDHDGEKMYTVVSTRDGLVYTAKEVKEPKDTSWRQEILCEVLQVRKRAEIIKVDCFIRSFSYVYF
jgi:hypothetical protein